MDITVEKLAKARAILNLNAIIRDSLPPEDYSRIYSKVQRKSPELTSEEARAIRRTLKRNGVSLL